VKPGSYRDLRKEDLEMLRKALAAPKPKRATAPPKPKPKAIKFSRFSAITATAKTGTSSGKAVDSKGGATARRPRKTSPTGARIKKREESKG
jgi:hypothetical protein